MGSVELSLDNITLLGDLPAWPDVEAALADWCDAESGSDEPSCRELPGGGSGGYGFSRSWVIDGAHLSVRLGPSALGSWYPEWGDDTRRGVEYGPLTRDVPQETGRPLAVTSLQREVYCDVKRPPVRLECNPNKPSDRTDWLRSEIVYEKVSRVDVAIDYPGVAVGDFTFRRPRVKPQLYLGRGLFGSVESLYLGTRTSDRLVRIYDKAKELGIEDVVLTRVEGVGRQRYVMDTNLFDGMVAWGVPHVDGLNTRDAGLLALALHYPEALERACASTRKRAAAVVGSACESLSPHPQDAYLADRRRLADEVHAFVHGGSTTPASIYAKGADRE